MVPPVLHAEGTGRTSRKQHIPFQVSPSPCRSRWNYSPLCSTEKASIWYLSCLLWKTNYKWQSCLAEPTLTTRGARQAQHNCSDSSSGVSCDFQGNHAWQEGHSHLNLSLLPDSPWAVPTYCSSRTCAQTETEQFSACQQNQWGVRWAPRLKEWPPPTAGWLRNSSACSSLASEDGAQAHSQNQPLGQRFLFLPPAKLWLVTIL